MRLDNLDKIKNGSSTMDKIALIRVSTILQTEENGGTSIQLQTEKLKQYADLNDLDLRDTIIDVTSGGLENRDGIEN